MSQRRRGAGRNTSWRRRRLRWQTVAIGALVMVLIVGLVWLVGFSPAFSVRKVEIHGTTLLTEGEVAQAAQVPMGRALARVNTDEIEERVAALAPVRSVRVSRGWPQRIRITVAERTTVFVAKQADGYVAVDDEGRSVVPLPKPPTGVLLAEGVPEAEWAGVARVVIALPAPVRERAQRITTRGQDAIVIHLTDKVTLEWGSADESTQKAQVLSALMTAVPDATVYNVSSPNHPTTRGAGKP